MDRDEWWNRLSSTTRQWLIDHNGEPVPSDVVDGIAAVHGPVTDDAWWVAETGPAGVLPTDEAVDWIEAVADDEGADR